ncbi:hypothetical protein ACFL67_03270 [candidate division KSB1 bacterium]
MSANTITLEELCTRLGKSGMRGIAKCRNAAHERISASNPNKDTGRTTSISQKKLLTNINQS